MRGILWLKCKVLRFVGFWGCLIVIVFKIKVGDGYFFYRVFGLVIVELVFGCVC